MFSCMELLCVPGILKVRRVEVIKMHPCRLGQDTIQGLTHLAGTASREAILKVN